MKYIKTYENIDNENFKIGDYVTCIDNSSYAHSLVLDKVYIVQDARICSAVPQILVNKYYNNSTRFIKSTPEEVEQFKNDLAVNKYNL